MSKNVMTNLQDAVCFLKEEMIYFHDYTMFFLLFILSFVSLIFLRMIFSDFLNRFLLFNESIEFIWIVLPTFILFFIALPSMKVLYLTDATEMPDLTLKATGHQWYWTYHFPEFFQNSDSDILSSYLLSSPKPLSFEEIQELRSWHEGKDIDELDKEELLKKSYVSSKMMIFRSLDVDTRVVLPLKTMIRVITTSEDVIHSWTVPVLGVKMDSVPGRLNQFSIESERPGVFFGQCSEICGVLHSFMPICVEFVNMNMFLSWIKKIK